MYCPLLNEFYLEDPKRKEDLKLGRRTRMRSRLQNMASLKNVAYVKK